MNDTEKLSIRKPNLYISEEMNARIRSFRFDNRFDSEAAAIRELIRLGLEASHTQQESCSEVGHGKA